VGRNATLANRPRVQRAAAGKEIVARPCDKPQLQPWSGEGGVLYVAIGAAFRRSRVSFAVHTVRSLVLRGSITPLAAGIFLTYLFVTFCPRGQA